MNFSSVILFIKLGETLNGLCKNHFYFLDKAFKKWGGFSWRTISILNKLTHAYLQQKCFCFMHDTLLMFSGDYIFVVVVANHHVSPKIDFDLSFKPCGAYKRAAFIWDSTLIRGNTVYKLNLKQNVLILCKTLDWSLCLLNLNLSSNSRLNIFRVTTLISGPC